MEKKYNPYIAEGYSPAEAYQSAVDGLTNQALALTPTSPNSLNFKKSRKPAIEAKNTTPFEGEKTTTSSVTVTTSVAAAGSDQGSGY